MADPSVWRDSEGRLRSGWVVTVFALVAVVSGIIIEGVIFATGLGHGEYSLTSTKIAASAWGHLASGVLATFVAWKLGQDAGLVRPRGLAWGVAAGAALLTVTVVLGGLASGTVGLAACDSKLRDGVLQLLFVGPTAFGEELWLRGAALRALARGTHPVFAVLGTGLVFGALHLLNPNASAVAALNVALVGIWFGAMAWRAQSVWPAFGAHLAWNWFEGFVWGQNVSGIQAGCSLFTATSQPGFWGGGAFGPEASGLTAVLLALACAVTVVWPRSRPAGR
ncbi:MAG: CPBP family intramembrane metalloprotease [Myxococcaceae bacterium]|nr:CPBP family intramembrane metalloprotease [Myxococcaceae bacterium]